MVRQCGSCMGCSSSSSREGVLKEAYEYGKQDGVNRTGSISRRRFIYDYGTPSTEEEIELYKEYEKAYEKGYADGVDIRERMKN